MFDIRYSFLFVYFYAVPHSHRRRPAVSGSPPAAGAHSIMGIQQEKTDVGIINYKEPDTQKVELATFEWTVS